MKLQLPEQLYDMSSKYHLRGGIDYSKLSSPHKLMMGLLYKKCKRIPEEQRDEETKALIETYKKAISFVNLDDLDVIIEDLAKSM